jgi:hypothetical protein
MSNEYPGRSEAEQLARALYEALRKGDPNVTLGRYTTTDVRKAGEIVKRILVGKRLLRCMRELNESYSSRILAFDSSAEADPEDPAAAVWVESTFQVFDRPLSDLPRIYTRVLPFASDEDLAQIVEQLRGQQVVATKIMDGDPNLCIEFESGKTLVIAASMKCMRAGR